MLQNNKIILRALEPEDLEKLYKWENAPKLWAVGNTRNPYSKYMLKQYILNSDKDIYENRQLRLMMVSVADKQVVGTVDLFDFDLHHSRIALGLFVDEAYQGMGFATAALDLVEKYVFDFLQIQQLYCEIASTNTASRKIFEKAGYEVHGLLKNWIKTPEGFDDIIVFQQFKSLYNKQG